MFQAVRVGAQPLVPLGKGRQKIYEYG